MAAVIACPTADILFRLLLGQATGPEAEDLVAHLEACDRCAALVKSLPGDDTLVEAARAPATEVDSPEMNRVRDLVERLRLQGPPLEDGDDPTAPDPSAVAVGSPMPGERYDFLTAPQGPDELGRLGSYRVLKVLGAGGMGVVFLAEDVLLKRRVALKVMRPAAAARPGARERFLREARAAANLEHDHIVTIFQVGEERGVPFLAMQWLKGVSLEERLKQPVALNTAEVLRLGRQIALGLTVAHDSGLIHRDIKPANLWLESEQGERIKILDFGLARAVADDTHLTQSGAIVGTPSYMAPEQASSNKVDGRCDLFSLGVVLYRLCAGELPFSGVGTMGVLASLARDTPPAPQRVNPAVPPALSDLVMRLLAKNPAERPASARAVADELFVLERQLAAQTADASATEVLSAAPARAPLAPKLGGKGPVRRRSRFVAAAVLLALPPLGYFFAGTILRIATNKGELVIENDDPNLEVTVKGPTAEVYDKVKDRRFVLTAGEYVVEVREEGDGGVRFATKKVSITRGGKETFNARMEMARTKPAESGDERPAAEWVLSIYGTLTVRGGDKQREVAVAGDLPTEPFKVLTVTLENNSAKRITDADLKHLTRLTDLTQLSLQSTPVGDAGLAHLTEQTNLRSLLLRGTKVSDAGLPHLAKLTKLTTLSLDGTAVGDAGLAHLRPLTNLTFLTLSGTKVSDGGLKHLKTLTNLADLVLDDTSVSDAGLEHLGTLTNLSSLALNGTAVSDAGLQHLRTLGNLASISVRGTKVSDAGLPHLTKLTNLRFLVLEDTSVSDAGLEQLKPLRTTLGLLSLRGTNVTDSGLDHLKVLDNLRDLDLRGTKVTAAGVDKLRQALPKCKIESDPPKK